MSLGDRLQRMVEQIGGNALTATWRDKLLTEWTLEERAAFRRWSAEVSRTEEGKEELVTFLESQWNRSLPVRTSDGNVT